MNEEEIKNLVDNAITLHREIATKTEQLKSLKATLVLQAHEHPNELAFTETGGKRWTAKGSDGSIARVNFPAPALVSEMEAANDKAKHAQVIAGDNFRQLFSTVKIYQLVEDFRTVARTLLTPRKAAALIELCEAESSPRVSFEVTKRTAEAVAA